MSAPNVPSRGDLDAACTKPQQSLLVQIGLGDVA
jgi:hypothetical protein